MNPTKQAASMMTAFLEDAAPFMDLLKIEGYFTDDMELTDKGKAVLQKHWEKKYPFGKPQVGVSAQAKLKEANHGDTQNS